MITGKCFCGEIHYTIEANILKSGICHCHDCQRLTGGTAWPFIVVPYESLVVHGETKEFMRPGASGKPVHVSFCGTCGSTLFGSPEIWPHIRIVGASSLDDKTLFSPDMYVWTEDAPRRIVAKTNVLSSLRASDEPRRRFNPSPSFFTENFSLVFLRIQLENGQFNIKCHCLFNPSF